MKTDELFKRALNFEFLSIEEGVYLFEHAPTSALSFVANELRKKQVPGNKVTWIIDRNVNTTTYTAEVNYSADQGLVSRVHDNDSLQTADTTMANFYNQHMQANIGRFDSISRLLGNSQNNTYKISTIRYNDSLIQTYLTTINNYDMGNVVELKKIITYRNEIATLQLDNNNIKNSFRNDFIANATIAKNINDAIVSTKMIEDIEQQVWAVYIAMQIEQRKPYATALNIVLPIAQMCPAQGGRAVYIARTIVALVNDTIVYNDSAACANVGYNFKVMPFKNVAADRLFKISLNPTKENLSYLSTGHEIKSIEFYSLEGKILVTYKKINKTGILPTDHLVAGMYYLHITYDDDFVLVHKFTKL